MKSYRFWLIVLALGFITAFGAHQGLIAHYAPTVSLWLSFLFAEWISKLVILLCVLLVIVSTVVTFVAAAGLRKPGAERARAAELMLCLVAGAATTLALASAWLTETFIRMSIARIGEGVSFAVTVPSHVEALLVLSVGTLTGLISLAGAAHLHRAWRLRSS